MNTNRFLGLAMLSALCGCQVPVPQMVTPYRMEIQQGNFVTQSMVSQLKPGMTREQVRFVLGTPLLSDPFHAERWEYVFRRTPENSQQLEQRHITVFFDKEGLLERVAGDVVPSSSSASGPAAGLSPQTPRQEAP